MEVDIESQQDFNKSLLSSSINLVGPWSRSNHGYHVLAKYKEYFQFLYQILEIIIIKDERKK